MNKVTKFVFCSLVLGAVSAGAFEHSAHAGATKSGTVSVDTTNMVANGAMGTASRSTNGDYIGCTIRANPSAQGLLDGVVFGSCTAAHKSALGTITSATCDITAKSAMASMLAMMTGLLNPDSFIQFKWKVVNGSKVCTNLRIANDSRYASKKAP